jgi:MurNAc alpha-1-phosphate uridylyltransferase
MKAMILAAGFGERLRPLTETTPKPLLKVGNKPLIQYHIERLVAAGIREVVINTSWLGDQIEAFLGDGSRFGVRISWSREDEPLETGGGIRRALPLLGSEPFLLVNGDVWTDYPLEELERQQWSEELDAHLVLVPNPLFNMSGDFSLSTDHIVGYPQADDITYTFSGVSVMRPEVFAMYSSASERFPIRDVLANGVKAGYVTGEVYRGEWWDVGTVARLEALNSLVSGKEVSQEKKPRVRLS